MPTLFLVKHRITHLMRKRKFLGKLESTVQGMHPTQVLKSRGWNTDSGLENVGAKHAGVGHGLGFSVSFGYFLLE
ncbi:MAG TPA: hypothetical protein VIU13_05805 [Chryseolinea sp.]